MDTIKMVSSHCLAFVIVFMIFHANGLESRKLHRSKRGWLNTGRPSAVQCAFNPCSVPGFCGEGRTCEMDENCIHHCNCNEDSKHTKCVGAGLVTTTPKKVQCTFDPCTSPAFGCGEGRQCVLGEFCMPECQCLDNETHHLCVGEKPEPTESVKKEFDEYVCVKGDSSCLHGECVQQMHGSSCICEKGWEGVACNVSQCTKKCHKDSYCHFVTTDVQICLASSDSMDLIDEIEGQNKNVCEDDYKVRTKEEQNCTNEVECIYGICDKQNGTETCICDQGATGVDCGRECCKECGEFGRCDYNEGIGETCLCPPNRTSDNCTSYGFDFLQETPTVPEDPTWHYWVVGSCAFVLLLLICLIVVVPYYLWRHRVILVMKVVHYFQEYEDDDDRQWDVFISYKSSTSDESFVVETLFPKLEKELGFKANVHFRDFVAGETISNNIISAVQGSRRTIMVISPSYVTSEFTKFEYQVAQQEMLKRKHRIIPILLEDISDCKETMDPTLKVILGSVTYIEWPKIESEKKLDKFWKRIELSMPKKKNRVLESPSSPDTKLAPSLKPSNRNVDISNKTNPKHVVADGNVYSIIDESKLNKEEVYDTLNEFEMLTEVIKKDTQNKSKQDEFLNVLKVDL